LVAGVAEAVAGLAVHVEDGPVPLVQEERVGGVVDERPEAPFAGAQLRFRAAEVGDVLHGAENPARPAVVASRDVALAVDDALLPVRMGHPVLDVVSGTALQRT